MIPIRNLVAQSGPGFRRKVMPRQSLRHKIVRFYGLKMKLWQSRARFRSGPQPCRVL